MKLTSSESVEGGWIVNGSELIRIVRTFMNGCWTIKVLVSLFDDMKLYYSQFFTLHAFHKQFSSFCVCGRRRRRPQQRVVVGGNFLSCVPAASDDNIQTFTIPLCSICSLKSNLFYASTSRKRTLFVLIRLPARGKEREPRALFTFA